MERIFVVLIVLAVASTAFAGDSPVELRLSADLVSSFDAGYTAAGVNGVATAQGPNATITPDGAVIVDPSSRAWMAGPGVGGIQYDVSAPNFTWLNYGGDYYMDYEMTVEFWWKRASIDPACLFGVGMNMSPSGTGFWELTADNTGIGVSVGYYVGAPDYVSSYSYANYDFQVGDWHHMAMVSDPSGGSASAGTIKVYVDGQLALDYTPPAGNSRTVYLNDHFWLTNNAATMVSLGGRAFGINDAGGDVTSSGGTGAGSGLGTFQQFKIWKGLKYESNFTPTALIPEPSMALIGLALLMLVRRKK